MRGSTQREALANKDLVPKKAKKQAIFGVVKLDTFSLGSFISYIFGWEFRYEQLSGHFPHWKMQRKAFWFPKMQLHDISTV